MNKKIVGALIGAAAILLPASAFASTNNVLFDNGTGGEQINVGTSVNLHAFVNTSAGQALQSVFVSFPGATGIAQHGKCYTLNPMHEGVSPVNGWDVSVMVDNTPSSAGSWGPSVTFYGLPGDAIDTQCSGSPVFGTQTFSNRLVTVDTNSTATVTGNSSGIGSGTAGSTAPTWFSSLIAQMQAQTAAILAAVAPKATGIPASSLCSELKTDIANATPGARTQANVVLQGFLLSKGMTINALTHGAAFGFYGVQTSAAVASFQAQNNCN